MLFRATFYHSGCNQIFFTLSGTHLFCDIVVEEAKTPQLWKFSERFEVTEVEKRVVCQHKRVNIWQRIFEIFSDTENKVVRY
jgi:hypothetical protein